MVYNDLALFLQFTAGPVAFVAARIAAAIQYMYHHDPIVVQQDIKPQNAGRFLPM